MADEKPRESWAESIAAADGRPAHPGDYLEEADRLLSMPNPKLSFGRIIDNLNNKAIQRDWCFTFGSWFRYEIEGATSIEGAKSRPQLGPNYAAKRPASAEIVGLEAEIASLELKLREAQAKLVLAANG